MAASKPTTLSYFVKRLRDSGYVVDELYTRYGDMDARQWTVVIDPGNASVFCTMIENKNMIGGEVFRFLGFRTVFPSKSQDQDLVGRGSDRDAGTGGNQQQASGLWQEGFRNYAVVNWSSTLLNHFVDVNKMVFCFRICKV